MGSIPPTLSSLSPRLLTHMIRPHHFTSCANNSIAQRSAYCWKRWGGRIRYLLLDKVAVAKVRQERYPRSHVLRDATFRGAPGAFSCPTTQEKAKFDDLCLGILGDEIVSWVLCRCKSSFTSRTTVGSVGEARFCVKVLALLVGIAACMARFA